MYCLAIQLTRHPTIKYKINGNMFKFRESATKVLSSSSDVEVIKANFIWTIHNFSFLSGPGAKKLKSSEFAMGNANEYKWRLRMYPFGCEEGSDTYISLFLQLVSTVNTEVLAKFEFSVIKANGIKHVLATHRVRSYTQFKSLGYHELIDRNQLFDEKNRMLKDDTLKIMCEVSIGTGNVRHESTSDELEAVSTESNLLRDLESLLESRSFADATLISGTERFPVHKAILSARSPVFAAMFEHDMKERSENEVEIKDVKALVLGQLIRFVYTGKTGILDESAARGLLAAADKYALDDLKLVCERVIFESLTVDNAVSTLVIADRHNSKNLKQQAIGFMKENAVRLVDNFASIVLNTNLGLLNK